MIQHYLKLAFRNLWKYRTQNVISIVGLAVGFACFALANLWIHYERTYDRQIKGIERTYLLYRENPTSDRSRYAMFTSRLAAPTLEHEYPEVEAAASYMIYKSDALRSASGKEVKMPVLWADSSFLSIDPAAGKLVQGGLDFLYDDHKAALTEAAAKALFGTIRVLGDSLKIANRSYRISAVLRDVEPHSNLYFGCWIMPGNFDLKNAKWGRNQCITLVRLRIGAHPEAFVRKMRTYQSVDGQSDEHPFKSSSLIPLGRFHYSEVNISLPVRIQYLYLFSATGALIIFCALLNYLSLFVMRMRARKREVDLRRVCGSSTKNLLALFGIEYVFVLLLSGLLGIALIELVQPAFQRLSQVSGRIYGETLFYFVGVLLLAYLCLLPFVLRRRQATFRAKRLTGNQWSVWLQLVVCLLFIFSVSVIMLQLRYLSKGDLGWERQHTAVLFLLGAPSEKYEAIAHGIDELPMVTASLKGVNPLFIRLNSIKYSFTEWDGKPASRTDPQVLTAIGEGAPFADFYGLKLREGEMVKAGDTKNILLNESAVRALGMVHPVGKRLGEYTVIGILKDFYTNAPTLPVEPLMLCGKYRSEYKDLAQVIVFKYRPGSWAEVKQRVQALRATTGLDANSWLQFINVEEVYNKLLASEQMLFRLLGVASFTCVLIAMFGVFSLVSLSCEQRRKEIAIRKVNGAKIRNILALFAREYLLILVAAAVVAFPVGYVLMKRWLQSYTSRIAIGWWLYAAIFAAVALLIAVCIGWRVWRAARSNPAETIKTE
jgi:ABC-type antimicrobial peptide transport system permease subunit